jgi:serine protease Do
VFYRKLLEGRLGFLGVGPRSENGIADPATGKATEVVLVARVLTGFPGAQAGLLTGDMIVDFDGKRIADLAAVPRAQARKQAGNAAARQRAADPPIAAFTAEISRREPGTRVPLRLLRCTTQHRVLSIAAAQEPARTLDGASLVPTILPNLSAQFNPLVGPGMRPGLYVMGVAADSPAATANLKPGDVILGIGRPFAQSGTLADELAKQLTGANPGSPINLIVSHVEQVRLTVTLGGRPVDRMNEDDMIIAQNRFADWWRSQTGEPSLRSGAAPSLPQLIIRPPNALPDPVVLP